MGQTAQKIIKLDKKELLATLNEALAEEWLAYYQYWVAAKIATGIMRKEISGEFAEHAKEELEHAEKLADRIVQLGGTPLANPSMWSKEAKCKYAEPKDDDVMALLKQNITAERCAIQRYKDICDMCAHGKDSVTFHLAYHIMADELEHEHDLEDFVTDIESFVKKYISKK